MLRHRGCDDAELAIELARIRAQHAADRQRLLAAIVAVFYDWGCAEAPPVWEAPASPAVH
jgi:hypothetical protein